MLHLLGALVVVSVLAAGCGNDDLQLPKATLKTAPGTCLREKRCLSARDVARIYRIAQLHDVGIRGKGVTVAVIMDAPVKREDLALFESMMHLQGVPKGDDDLKTITVLPSNGDAVEATLDVETVRMIAPEANIRLYIAPLDNFDVALKRVVADGVATIANFSAGGCYPVDASPNLKKVRAADEAALQEAVDARPVVNVFVSAGDHGVYDCRSGEDDDPDWTIAVDEPSSSPNAVSVGGTFLERSASGGYLDETAWENPFTTWGTGGGNDSLATIPRWQRGPGVDNPLSDGHRQLPDVSAPSDGQFIWPIVVNGEEKLVGGTSASSPFWAGLAALYTQLAKAAKPVGIDDLGMLNKAFYAVARASKPNTVFHDVVRGANFGYQATPGWDYATGLGSPIADRLGDAIVAWLKAHPPPA